MNTADTSILQRQSVTANDYSIPAMLYVFPTGGQQQTPGLSAYWSWQRDRDLKNTLFLESMWSSAVFKTISKQAALGFSVDDSQDKVNRARRAQRLFLHADYVKGVTVGGWVSFVSRHLLDVLLTDNGGFIEVIRASNARGSRVLGLAHLSSHRCWRTGDAETPVIYNDSLGKQHAMKAYQVLSYADMSGALGDYAQWYTGFCAASRAYETITRLSAIQQYLREKVTGSRATAIHFVGPISAKTLDSGLRTADEEGARTGKQLYRGANVIPTIGDQPPQVATIPLSEIPDGFDAETERKNAYLVYANALGVPVQDIQPLSGQGLGTGTQSVILAEAAEGYGLAVWRKWFEQTMNETVLPNTTVFSFSTNDIRDKKASAEVEKMRADTRKTRIESGELSVEEARQLAADAGDLPQEFLVQSDETPGGTLDDTEKPVKSTEPGDNDLSAVDWRAVLGVNKEQGQVKALGDSLASMLAEEFELANG